MKVYIPEGYKSILGMYDTQKAISLIHRLFEDRLGALLNLYRVSAPLFVEENSGLNDTAMNVRSASTFSTRPTTRPRWFSPWPSGSAWR